MKRTVCWTLALALMFVGGRAARVACAQDDGGDTGSNDSSTSDPSMSDTTMDAVTAGDLTAGTPDTTAGDPSTMPVLAAESATPVDPTTDSVPSDLLANASTDPTSPNAPAADPSSVLADAATQPTAPADPAAVDAPADPTATVPAAAPTAPVATPTDPTMPNMLAFSPSQLASFTPAAPQPVAVDPITGVPQDLVAAVNYSNANFQWSATPTVDPYATKLQTLPTTGMFGPIQPAADPALGSTVCFDNPLQGQTSLETRKPLVGENDPTQAILDYWNLLPDLLAGAAIDRPTIEHPTVPAFSFH